MLLDLDEVLNAHRGVHDQVGTIGLGTVTPDLGLSNLLVPVELLCQDLGSFLGIRLGANDTVLDGLAQLLVHGLCHQVDTVVLVRRLGQARLAGLLADGLPVGHHGVGHDEVALSVLILQVLQADLDVKLTAACDHVLSALLGGAHNQGIGLGQLLQTLHQLGQVLAILGLHCNLHDRGHAVLHVGDVVRILQRGDCTRLQDVLVNADQCHSVTAGHILDLLRGAAHHQHGTLDVLHVQVLLAAGLVVRALDTDLLAGSNGAREHAAEGIEAALVRGGHHLRHIHHQWT
mmetsp:Transcript_101970/g.141726  ORF Transcript_101970/g.141726 Transcript_101970/m.141726 type:complete len:289 (+) Transcript_101970:696-1562(+)